MLVLIYKNNLDHLLNCSREGGHSGWLANNLNQSDEAPAFHEVTARWTFGGKWDPEAKIRALWNVLAY